MSSPSIRKRKRANLFAALAFLAPNILGVLTFTVFPVIFSIMLAFSNWDLRLHNMYKDEPLRFVGFENFVRLFTEADFLRYLGNTLFLMMGIPFAVGGSLFAAILLSKDTRGGGGRVYAWIITAALLVASCGLLAAVGLGSTGMVLLLVGLACGVLVMGVGGGVTIYRTLFYTPHFTAGVATYLLWKKLYNPQTGPINTAIQPVLDVVTTGVQATPPWMVSGTRWLFLAGMISVFAWVIGRLRRWWIDGELGGRAALIPLALIGLPIILAYTWSYTQSDAAVVIGLASLIALWHVVSSVRHGREFFSQPMEGAGSALMLAMVAMIAQFVLLGGSALLHNLPAMSADGLDAPQWIADYAWAKPSLMLMGFWGAIGSNNMLLYLAALSNVPEELYEASDIDGASRFQRFWHVTWPQLAPTTFFISVMATIGGLQGGFEMARTMTRGGPAGATTTLSYFIYTEGFETGRLAFAAAVAWALFLLVFSLTLFNWRFGNKYVND